MPLDGAGKPAELTALLEILRGHNLVEPGELARCEVADAERLADTLLRSGALSPYQLAEVRRGAGHRLIFGQYVLLEPLGEGGMGQVFKARHQKMRRVVALKLIRQEVAGVAVALQRFEQEIAAAAQLSHPNVIQAYDADEVDGVHFFVMEFIEGADLSQLVKRLGPRPVAAACDYIQQAALGLQHAHERGLVHRDIKPSNLLLGYKEGVVKILDMGLARVSQAAQGEMAQLTTPGTVMGTIDYISPEQAQNARSADIRSDLYSLGCTFYFLLTGRPPFPEGTYTEKLIKHLADAPEPVSQIRPDIPAKVQAVLAKLLAKQPQDRYQLPAELAEALAPFAQRKVSHEYLRPGAPAGPVGNPTPVSPMQLPKAPPPKTPTPQVQRNTPRESALAAPSRTEPVAQRLAAANVVPASFVVPESLTDFHPLLTPPRPVADAPAPPRSPRAATATAVLGVATLVVALIVVIGGAVLWRATPSSVTPVAIAPTEPNPLPTAVVVLPRPTEPPTIPIPPTTPKVGPPTAPTTTPTTKPPSTELDGPPKPPPILTGAVLTTKYRSADKSTMRAALSPNGRWLATGSEDETVDRWDLGNVRAKPPPPVKLQLWNYRVEGLAVDNDGRVLVNAARDFREPGQGIQPSPTISVWDPTDDVETAKPFRHPRNIRNILSLTWAGKKLFLSGGRDRGEVRFWDLEKKGEPQVFPTHVDGADALAASEDGRWALSGGRDNKVVLFDLTGGQPPKPLGSHGNRVACIAFGPPASRTAVSAGLDQKFFVWDLAKGTHQSFSAPGDLVRCLAVAPDGRSFLAGVRVGDEDRVVWRDLNGNELAAPFGEGKGPYLSVAYSADGVYALVYCGGDQTLRRWELTRKESPR